MTTWPITVILTVSAVLGTMLFLKFLRGERGEPIMIAAHLILGLAALEQLAMLFRGAPNGESLPGEPLLKVAGTLFVFAAMLGFAAPLLVNRSRSDANAALWAHVSVAGAGFVLFLAWVTGR
jgi:hypothetical protein